MVEVRRHSLGGADEIGDPNAPPESRLWCISLYRDALSSKHDADFKALMLRDNIRSLHRNDRWQQLRDPKGHPFTLWEDFCQFREPFGLGMEMDQVRMILAEPEGSTRTVGAVLQANGGDRRSPEVKDQSRNRETDPLGKSDTADYIKARLRRDDPDLADRVERGELSANAAATLKGWRKKSTAYQDLVADWRRASEEERAAFEDYIADGRRSL